MIHDIGQITQEAITQYVDKGMIHERMLFEPYDELALRKQAGVHVKMLNEDDAKHDLLIVSPNIKQQLDDHVSSLPSYIDGQLTPSNIRREVLIYNTGFAAPYIAVNTDWTGATIILFTTKDAVVNVNSNYPASLAKFIPNPDA